MSEASMARTAGFRTAGVARAGRTRRQWGVALLTYVILTVLGVLFAFPFLWTISTSLKTAQETRLMPPTLFPEVPQWLNYVRVWTSQPVGRWMLNSLTVIVFAVPGAVISSTLCAYAFARFNFPGRDFLFMVLLSTLMLPFEVTLIPQYLLFHRLGWINTYLPLTVPSWFGGSAVSIFLLRQFLKTIPRDLDEAAVIDGANSLQILWHVILPLSGPALATVTILQFLGHWNDFLGPFIYLNKQALFTMSVGLRYFQTVPEVVGEPKEHLLMAAAVLMSIPSIALFFVAQRQFVRGIVLTGIKG